MNSIVNICTISFLRSGSSVKLICYYFVSFFRNLHAGWSTWKCKWGAQETARVFDVMRADYISSEENDVDETTKTIVRYNVRRLPWESPSLYEGKRKSWTGSTRCLSQNWYGAELFLARMDSPPFDLSQKTTRSGQLRTRMIMLLMRVLSH